jgi:small-conductance mechanosensitive channel
VAAAAVLDGLAVLALWAVIHLGLGVLFARSPLATEAGLQAQLAAVVLKSLVAWRAYVLLFRIYLRPVQPLLRIAPVGDASAHRLFRLFDLAVIVAILTQAWSVLLVTPAALDAADLTNSVVLPGILIYVVLRARRDIAGWFTGLIDDSAGKRAVKAAIAVHWHWIALPILIVLTLARIYDALSVEFTMPSGATLNILVGLLLAETLLSFIVRSGRAAAAAESGTESGGRLLPFLVRAVRATLWVLAAAVLVRTWAVDVLALIDEQEWRDFRHAWATSIMTALGAYLAWEAVHFATEPRDGATPVMGPQSEEKREAGGGKPPSASRLETLAPILRLLFGTIIIVTAALMILGSLGISITPFIAGASVIGLAISFGSQTLVHDIVSGLFYLADDAFRVGEYIDVGKAEGTVEGFTLRSIRLRHQSGQIHTIPFGQLGQITNFSRDWTTLKFNLRFDRNTDIEKLRKTTKKVGLAMVEDPELKDDIIEPLKLQGVADIDDSATIMRFKITVHPTRPSFLQREAVKRLIAAFKDSGIEFAGAVSAAQAVGGLPSVTTPAAAPAGKPV